MPLPPVSDACHSQIHAFLVARISHGCGVAATDVDAVLQDADPVEGDELVAAVAHFLSNVVSLF
jgi:hypothetical protein